LESDEHDDVGTTLLGLEGLVVRVDELDEFIEDGLCDVLALQSVFITQHSNSNWGGVAVVGAEAEGGGDDRAGERRRAA
jgi:hypothetical protein